MKILSDFVLSPSFRLGKNALTGLLLLLPVVMQPASQAGAKQDNTGHHHLIIDAGSPPFDKDTQADGQTGTIADPPAGSHTLQWLFADHNHVPQKTPAFHTKSLSPSLKRRCAVWK